jgi:hypothetical protein
MIERRPFHAQLRRMIVRRKVHDALESIPQAYPFFGVASQE